MQIKLVDSEQEIAECFTVMSQLRTHLNEKEFIQQVIDQQKQGYQLVKIANETSMLGVAGFVIGHKLAWGKYLYVDDLVISGTARSQGVGQKLIDWLHSFALANNCQSFHLDSGVQRFSAHKFYLREGFNIASHHFSKLL